MTDEISALGALDIAGGTRRNEAFDMFFAKWKSEPLVLLKWLGLQAGSNIDGNLETMKRLMEDEACYNAKNPNNNYSVRFVLRHLFRATRRSMRPPFHSPLSRLLRSPIALPAMTVLRWLCLVSRQLPRRRRIWLQVPGGRNHQARRHQPPGRCPPGEPVYRLQEVRRGQAGTDEGRAGAHPRCEDALAKRLRDCLEIDQVSVVNCNATHINPSTVYHPSRSRATRPFRFGGVLVCSR